MAKINTPKATPTPTITTHEGGRAARITPELELRRSVMACLLWEDTFYESGESIATRIKGLVDKNDPAVVAKIAIEARSEMNLRHVPLLLCRQLAKNGTLKADTLTQVIQRPDELTEFLAIYWKNGREKLSAQVKKGLAGAFPKFNAYSLAKYNQTDKPIKLRDVLFLTHPKPRYDDEEYSIKVPDQEDAWKKLVDGTLESPDTWEVALSGGADKKETFERLIAEKKLGALALLRNLRNMIGAGVSLDVIKGALAESDVRRVLPFRFIAAAKFAPMLEPELEKALFRSMKGSIGFTEPTVVLVDHSGSMEATLSGKSTMTRSDAACGIAMIVREMCANCRVFAFSTDCVEVPTRRGFALRDAICASSVPAATMLAKALATIPAAHRVIVISDEQSHDNVEGVKAERAYMINVASYQNGVGYHGKWTHVDGFSEAVIRYIQAIEKESLNEDNDVA